MVTSALKGAPLVRKFFSAASSCSRVGRAGRLDEPIAPSDEVYAGGWEEGIVYNLTVAAIISQAGDAEALAGLAHATPLRRLAGRNATKADVLFFDLDGRRVAVKTYAPRGFVIRNTFGRWLIRREARAYRVAAGISGLPAFLGRPDAFSLATVWVDAKPLSERKDEALAPEVFDRLSKILDELHARGVALADLHHRDVLLADDGSLFVIDLATAWVLGKRPWFVRRLVFERFRESDRVNLARMRARFTGGDVEAAVASVSPAAAAWHRRGRRVKGWLDRLRGKRR